MVLTADGCPVEAYARLPDVEPPVQLEVLDRGLVGLVVMMLSHLVNTPDETRRAALLETADALTAAGLSSLTVDGVWVTAKRR